MDITYSLRECKRLIAEIQKEVASLEMWSWKELLGHIPESDGVESEIVSSIRSASEKLESLAARIG